MAGRYLIRVGGILAAAAFAVLAPQASPPSQASGAWTVHVPGFPARSSVGFSTSLPLLLNSYQFTSTVQLTFGSPDAIQPALSPDNTRVVFVDASVHPEVWLAGTSGGSAANLTMTPNDDEDTPTFTPDGESVIFASNRSGDWDIYLVDIDGGNVRPAAGAVGSDEMHPALAPDGDHLVFSSNRGGNWDIYRAPFGNSEWVQLTDDPATDRLPSFSADGHSIVFRSERDSISAAYRMAPDGSGVTRVTSLDSAVNYPLIVPDGSGVVYVALQGGVDQVMLVNPAGSGVRQVWSQPGWSALTPRVAGGGSALVFAAAPEGQAHRVYLSPFESPLYRIGAAGYGEPTGLRCGWEAGTWAYGLITVWQETGDRRYLAWVRNWIDGCIAARHPIGHVNDGLLGLAAISMWQAEGGSAAPRLRDGSAALPG